MLRRRVHLREIDDSVPQIELLIKISSLLSTHLPASTRPFLCAGVLPGVRRVRQVATNIVDFTRGYSMCAAAGCTPLVPTSFSRNSAHCPGTSFLGYSSLELAWRKAPILAVRHHHELDFSILLLRGTEYFTVCQQVKLHPRIVSRRE